MKKIFIFAVILTVLLSGCAKSKTFKRSDGTEFTARPYGWMDRNDYRIDGVEYDVCTGNVVWSIVLSETIVGPFLITGVGLYEPVSYSEDTNKEKEE